jgi:hypothetical protein
MGVKGTGAPGRSELWTLIESMSIASRVAKPRRSKMRVCRNETGVKRLNIREGKKVIKTKGQKAKEGLEGEERHGKGRGLEGGETCHTGKGMNQLPDGRIELSHS